MNSQDQLCGDAEILQGKCYELPDGSLVFGIRSLVYEHRNLVGVIIENKKITDSFLFRDYHILDYASPHTRPVDISDSVMLTDGTVLICKTGEHGDYISGVVVANIEIDNGEGVYKVSKGIFLNEARIFGICKHANE